MSDPQVGMNAVASCLRPDGAMGLLLYTRNGRAGLELLQSLFRDMGLGQDESSIAMARETLSLLSPDLTAAEIISVMRHRYQCGAIFSTDD